jgi:hypothetical protein
MRRWVIATAVAILLSLGGTVGLFLFSVAMIRRLAQAQQRGERLLWIEGVGAQIAQLWERHSAPLGGLVAAACFAASFGVAAFLGRKSNRPGE